MAKSNITFQSFIVGRVDIKETQILSVDFAWGRWMCISSSSHSRDLGNEIEVRKSLGNVGDHVFLRFVVEVIRRMLRFFLGVVDGGFLLA